MNLNVPSFLTGIISILYSAGFGLSAKGGSGPHSGVGSLLKETIRVNSSIKSLSYTLLMKERYSNTYITKKTDFKVNLKPYKLYLKQQYPNEGMEILYTEQTGNKALLNRNVRAFSVMNLNPTGNLMRKESHHSIFKGGYGFIIDVLDHLYSKYPEETTDAWQFNGLVKYDNVLCYKITFNNPDFKYVKYTIQKGENLETLSEKLKVCDYMIFESNPRIKSFDDYKPGTEINVPGDYAKQIILYIDAEKYVPVGLKVYDDKGLFDEYTYQNIKINPVFKDEDFNARNPSYGFH